MSRALGVHVDGCLIAAGRCAVRTALAISTLSPRESVVLE